MSQPDPALKGKKDGNCNRTACQQPGATWYNQSTRAYYCPSCARKINKQMSLDDRAFCLRQYKSVELCLPPTEVPNGS